MNELVGREQEILTLERWLEKGGRLFTIMGPPGVGKSRIARAVAVRGVSASSAS